MASRHMHFLRRYAKPILAVMGVVCMITFVVGPALVDLIAGGSARRAAENPLVVTWTKGKVHDSEIRRLRNQRFLAHSFVFNVVREALQRGGTPFIHGQPLSLDRFGWGTFVGILADDSDEELVLTMLLAEEAQRQGIVVDREAVKGFLREISAGALGEGDWLDIAKVVIGDNHLTVDQLVFEFLPYELRAQHARMLAMPEFLTGRRPAVPPGELWDYFNRLNRRVSIEAYPIDVAPLIAQVKAEPPEAELQKLYNEGKYRDPNPLIPEPGFHQPHKVAFGYLKVDFAPFLEEAQKQITDEQIAEQYEKDVAGGMHKVQEIQGIPPAEEKKEGEQPAEEKKEAEKGTDEKKDSGSPVEKKDDADASPEEKSANARPEGAPDENPCQDGEPGADQPEKPADKPAEKAAEEKPAEARPGEAKPAEEKPAEQKTDEPKTDESKTDEPKTDQPKTETRIKPLEEVREEIRTRLAQPVAEDARNKAVQEATDAIRNYGREYRRWLSVKEFKKEAVQQPAPLDLKAIAARHGFESGTTPLIDRFEAQDYEIGRDVRMFDFEALRRGLRDLSNMELSFADIAFREDEPVYEPREANSLDPDVRYIFFRTAEQKPAEVSFQDARPRLVEAWKKQQAFELALTDARKLADKAKEAMSLGEAVGDSAKVFAPPPFSWMTTGSLAMGFGEPEISRVAGLDLAGQEFMKAVFQLQPGQTGVAPNQPRTRVYVVRLISQEPSDEVLRQQFLESGDNFQVIGIAQRERMQAVFERFRELEKRYEVTWHRPPQPSSRRMM